MIFNLENIEESSTKLEEFEKELGKLSSEGKIKGPVHFSRGNEFQLIKIFRGLREGDYLLESEKNNVEDIIKSKKIVFPFQLSSNHPIFRGIKNSDWICTSYRNHYHALLKGINEEFIKKEVIEGKSMHICSKEKKFITSAIVPGHLPVALGIALAIKKKGLNEHVWAFCGDMASETGVFEECTKYAENYKLPITFIVEDNGLSVDTPTEKTWGGRRKLIRSNTIRYFYKSLVPHQGIGKEVGF